MHSKGNEKLYEKVLLENYALKRAGHTLKVLFSSLAFVLFTQYVLFGHPYKEELAESC